MPYRYHYVLTEKQWRHWHRANQPVFVSWGKHPRRSGYLLTFNICEVTVDRDFYGFLFSVSSDIPMNMFLWEYEF